MSDYDLTDGVQLARAALEHIERHPGQWNQETYRCATGMCLAGWMAELSPEVEWVHGHGHDSQVVLPLSGGLTKHVASWAARKLGIDIVSAEGTIFSPGNSLDDLRYYVAQLVAGQPGAVALPRCLERP